MSKSQFKIPSPARSQGSAPGPRRARVRRTLSAASPRSDASAKLSSVVEKFIEDDFVLTPLKRRSVLADDTAIEAPRRASWWKRLEGSSRDVLEALDTNKMADDLLVEEYEFEVEKDNKDQSVPESSDNESIASIVVPQRRLFNQNKQPQGKFGDIMGSRKSLGKTNIDDESIEDAPKNLFNKGPRNRLVFPSALLNSTNKTINKTAEPETNKQTRPNLFGQAGTKRKNMFTDFILSDSEEDSEVQHKVFGFKKINNKRMSLGTRTRRMPSLTPSMTTEIDIDDWNLLPSSTMIGAQEVSKMSIDNVEQEQVLEEKQDDTLIEDAPSLNRSTSKKSIIQDDENDKTLTNDNIEDAGKYESKKSNGTHNRSKTLLNESVKRKSLQNKSSTRPNAENEEIIEEVVGQQLINGGTNKLVTNKLSLEDEMAELHGETIAKEKTQQIVLPNKTDTNVSKSGQETNPANHEIQKVALVANNRNQNDNDHLFGKEKSMEELVTSLSNEKHKSQNRSKEASISNQDEDMNDACEKDKSEEEVEPNVEEQESWDRPDEASKTNEDLDDEKDESEEEVEPSAAEEESENGSKEISHEETQDENVEDISEKDKTEEDVEPSAVEQESDNGSKELSHDGDLSEEDQNEEENEPSASAQVSQDASKEVNNENQDEDMEEMVWNDNDEEMPSDKEPEKDAEVEQNEEVSVNQKGNQSGGRNEQKEANKSRNVTNESHRIVDASIDIDQIEEENDVVDETPNNSTHDTTGRNRKRESTKVKSPEVVLQNMTNDNESFRPIGRSTTFRKSKSVYETMNMRPSLAPLQETTLGSEGSRNSSTEGSEWDSHRTTRKTIRQTLGKDYTTRKSLRALVMEESAKRQTDLYNKTHLNKTKNKTIVDEGTDNNASKVNKTKNKIAVEDTINKNASTFNKTKNKTILEDANNKNATMNKTKNKTVLEDIDDQHIRFRRTSNRKLSGNASPILKSPVHGTSTHHVPDPLISEQQVSYHKSLHDINEPEISTQSYREESINVPDADDSGPEISMHASYGQGMSADTHHEASADGKKSDLDMLVNKSDKTTKEFTRCDASVRTKSSRNSEEILDYEASDDEKSEEESEIAIDQDNIEQDNSNPDDEKEDSLNELEAEQTNKDESEQENEDSQQEIEAESDKEEYEQEADPESEQEHEPEYDQEESQQEIEAGSDKEDSQQEIEVESDQGESQQEIEVESDQGESQQEIDAESEQEPEQDPESENELDHDISQASETNEISQEPETVSDDENDDFISRLDSQANSDRRSHSRVVFDSQMMSDEEIDFEGVSRQTKDLTEQSERSELSRSIQQESSRSLARVSEPSHNLSVGTKKSMLLAQMQKIAQQNMEIRQKIRDDVQKSLKPSRNIMSPVPKYSIRRLNQEPRQPKKKPKPTGVPMESLPKAFVEDLTYKPPKRFQPANAPWITKRLYKFLETKLEPKYDYRARVRAEELVQTIHSFTKLVRRRDAAPAHAVDELKQEMARLRIVTTHYDFYEFFHEFMPREVRIKVNPDVVNRIPMPRNGVFGEILQPRTTAVE